MAEKRNANFSIPDDPESSTYRFINLAAKRARKFHNFSRTFLTTTSKKTTITAMEEVRRGLVSYQDFNRDGEPEPEFQPES